MKLTIFFFLILSPGFLRSSVSTIDLRNPGGAINKEFFLSFPKSGTNLALGLIQALTHKPYLAIQEKWTPSKENLNRANIDINTKKSPMFRTHGRHKKELVFLDRLDQNRNKLIMILRNPKECIVRFCKYSEEEFLSSVLNNKGGFPLFISNLQAFDSWKNNQTKLIVYYEDLIKNPRAFAITVLEFLGESQYLLEDVILDYEKISSKILSSYQSQWEKEKRLFSGGDQEIFHSRNFSKVNMKKIDSHLEEQYPILWSKYLHRYQTK